MRFHLSTASSLGVLSRTQTWVCLNGSRGRLQIWLEGWNSSSVRIVIQKTLQGDLLAAFQDLKGPTKKTYTKVWSMREDKGEWLYTERGLLHWIERKTLYSEVGETLELDARRGCRSLIPGTVWNQVGWCFEQSDLKILLPMEARLHWVIFGEVPFQPKPFYDFVIPGPNYFSYG